LRVDYLKRLGGIQSLSLCVVGQDRYPKGANGIAFCKNTFDEFFDHYCCGKEVLSSLGFSEKFIRSNYSDPIVLFHDLLQKGIGFINISNELLDHTTEKMFQEYQTYNTPFLQKSERIIILGSSKTKPLFKSQYPEFEILETVIHPSLKAKEFNLEKWNKVWGARYLAKVCNTAYGK
jgi:hypothetical protein